MKAYIGAAAIVVAMSAMCATAVNAQSLKDKEYFAAQEKELAGDVPIMNKACDTNIAVKIDWTKPPADRDHSPSGYCDGGALSGIRRVCESSQLGKDTVKQKIKSVTCTFGPQRTIVLKDGAINYTINYSSSNDADFVFEYLQEHL
jgi:hypothetical protein